MKKEQPEPTVDPKNIPVAPPENDDQPFLIYQGIDGMPMHREGKFYFAPRNFNITRGKFSDDFENPDLADAAARLWASRFQNPNGMQW